MYINCKMLYMNRRNRFMKIKKLDLKQHQAII